MRTCKPPEKYCFIGQRIKSKIRAPETLRTGSKAEMEKKTKGMVTKPERQEASHSSSIPRRRSLSRFL